MRPIEIKKYNIFSGISFIISPFLSIPFVWYGINRKNKVSTGYIVFFLMLVSFSFVPKFSNDLARYYERYYFIQENSFDTFLQYFYTNQQDYLYYFLIYVVAKLNIPLQYLTATLCGVILGVRFFIVNKIFYSTIIRGNDYSSIILLTLLTLSLATTISGHRYQLGLSFLILSIYYIIVVNEKKGWIFLALGVLTHFSLLAFVPAFIVLRVVKSAGFYKSVFLFSFLFFLLSTSTLSVFATMFNVSQVKINGYLGSEDFILGGLGQSTAGLMVFGSKILKIIFIVFYLLKTFNRKSKLRNILYIVFATSNLFFSAYTVFDRYMELVFFVFLILYIYENYNRHNWYLVPIIILYSFDFTSQFIRMLPVLIPNYSNLESYLFITMILKKIGLSSIL